MFNKKLKELYLKSLKGYADGTIKNYRYILSKASVTEDFLNKDIYDFTLEECDKLLKSYNNRSLDMANVNKSCLESYVDFCIQEGYVSTLVNFFKGLSRQDLNKYVDKEAIRNKYITYEELLELEQQCVNAQDAVIARLLFIGVRGEECSDLISLKVDNVTPEKIILQDREIIIDNSTYELVQEAIHQDQYIKGNGEPSASVRSLNMVLNQSEYVIKSSGSKKVGEINYQTLRMRVNRVKDYFGNPYLNIRNIWFSGIIHAIKQIKEQKGELTKEDYINVHRTFGYAEGYVNKTIEEVRNYL